MYTLKSIGTVEVLQEESYIWIDEKFRKALKHLDGFSHMHVFFLIEEDEKYRMKKVIMKIREIDMRKGFIAASRITDMVQKAELIDIKPYFPSEDTARDSAFLSEKKENYITVRKAEDSADYEMDAVGEIRSVNGENYIQMDDGSKNEIFNQSDTSGISLPDSEVCKSKALQMTGKYIIVFWWFHKFDAKRYRSITECNPPYENAPRSGVFATRSPVRPNPIAMTVVHISRIDFERKRIYIKGIESFDKTPCIGIFEYDINVHGISDASVPEWIRHWPKCIDETVKNTNSAVLEINDSKLIEIISDDMLQENARAGKGIKRFIEKVSEESIQYSPNSRKDEIRVYGARENNLKGIDIRIPYGKITAVVGVSGSGKSSLVNDTIYAECKRRMECLSLNHNILQNPKVDGMTGCIPAVLITQTAIQGNVFSTVGTYTDAYDCLRNIYANTAIRHCPDCGNEIIPLSEDRIIAILKRKKNVRIYSLSNSEIKEGSLEKKVDQALQTGEGAFLAKCDEEKKILFQTKQKCYRCDKLMFEMTPALFSYMDADSRCPVCNGTGKIVVLDEKKIIEHPEQSLLEGASSFYGKLRTFQNNSNANWMKGQVFALAENMHIDLEKPWCELPDEYREALLHGDEREVTFQYHNKKNGRKGEIRRHVEGIIPIMERILEENPGAGTLEKYMTKEVCPACAGERLGREGRMDTVQHIRYPEAARMTFYELKDFCDSLVEVMNDDMFAKIEYALHSLIEIAQTAINLGIGYLQLSQETNTVSGGEGQRLKLLSAFKNHISNILYIFDEPSKGLHPKDYEKIINLLHRLVDEGNTIIMVEHNEDMIRIADHIIEIGPGAGKQGGELTGEGTLAAMLGHNGTQISKYMNKAVQMEKESKKDSTSDHGFVCMQNLNCNNLKNVSIRFPKNALTCICGVSGSGKSSLMKGEICNRANVRKDFAEVILVDQLPIGKTSKSIVATYIGIMDLIRCRFAGTEMALQNGWDEKYFSFNSSFGQCETCQGEGRVKVKYTEGTFVQCPDCRGKRYKKEIRSITYRGKRIDEVLAMSVDEVLLFLREREIVTAGLDSLQKVGLGYLQLGQGTATLSGGEAARLKLAKELITRKNSNILYLLDEPTTGLHFSDIDNLMKLIDEMIRNGNTVIAIEHNRQFTIHCDWRIELGPGAGQEGGNVIDQGPDCAAD